MLVIKWNVPADSPYGPQTYWSGDQWVSGVDRARVYPNTSLLPDTVGDHRFKRVDQDGYLPYYGSGAAAIVLELEDREILFGDPNHVAQLELKVEGYLQEDQLAEAIAKMISKIEGAHWTITHVRATVGQWAAYGFRSKEQRTNRNPRSEPKDEAEELPTKQEKRFPDRVVKTDISGPPKHMEVEPEEQRTNLWGVKPKKRKRRISVSGHEVLNAEPPEQWPPEQLDYHPLEYEQIASSQERKDPSKTKIN